MIELEDALEKILAFVPQPKPERLGVFFAGRRILWEKVVSPVDLPLFDNSAMDGYAVRAADVAGASLETPVCLRLSGRVGAGEVFSGTVSEGCCVRIFTGSPLPKGADAVVMQEDSRAEEPDKVWILDAAKPWENVRLCGEDFPKWTVLGSHGERISAGRLGLFSAAGINEVTVGSRPRVALLATGSELVWPGETLEPGKIHESNRAALAAMVTGAGGEPVALPFAKDTPKETRKALEEAFEQCDVVATTGGVSVGELDFVKSAFQEMGGNLELWKVAIKPGRPFAFGQLNGKFLFGLPGNPVSAFVTFVLLVRPFILRWQGARTVEPPTHEARLGEEMSNPDRRRHFMRVKVEDDGTVISAGTQASHMMLSLAEANALLDMPRGATLQKGAAVKVIRLDFC